MHSENEAHCDRCCLADMCQERRIGKTGKKLTEDGTLRIELVPSI